MTRTTRLPCPRCKASPHRRYKHDGAFAIGYPMATLYRCIECGLYYPDWTEAEAQAAILTALRKHPRVGWVGINNASDDRGRRTARLNQPDLSGYLKDGRALYVEIKTHSGIGNSGRSERFERQQAWLDKARACGCVAFVAWGQWDVEEQLGHAKAE